MAVLFCEDEPLPLDTFHHNPMCLALLETLPMEAGLELDAQTTYCEDRECLLEDGEDFLQDELGNVSGHCFPRNVEISLDLLQNQENIKRKFLQNQKNIN